MKKYKSRLYFILSLACLAGYVWLFLNLYKPLNHNGLNVCLIKRTTGMPCPSCGSTRSVISLLNGDLFQALSINPMGFIIACIMLVAPVWIAIDMLTRRKTLFEFYKKTEYNLSKPIYAIPLILMVIINWVWNITKGL